MTERTISKQILATFLIASLSCQSGPRTGGPSGPSGPKGPAGPADGSGLFSKTGAESTGLVFRVSEGRPDVVPYEGQKPTRGDALTAAETKDVLSRLPDVGAKPDDTQDFALRERSLPPPKTGTKIAGVFPPPAPPDGAQVKPGKAGPLEVLRAQPQGDVPLAPHVSVTFNQPMVAVTSLDELAKLPPAAKLSPEPPGKWRWIGTKTVLFEAGERFPMATTFTLEVPAGTTSAVGGKLAKTYSMTFQTPPPVLQSTYPGDSGIELDPIIFLGFDQRVDPAKVLATTKITAGTQVVTGHIATPEDIAADKVVAQLVKNHEPGRWVAIKLDAPLPKATSVDVRVGPGTPSAEGPRTTTKAQSLDFRTYDPFEIDETQCGWDGCRPLDGWSIRFNNAIDMKKWSNDLVKVEPAVKGMKIHAGGNYISFNGKTKGRTKYKVTLDASLTDSFGQTLGTPRTVVFDVGTARPTFFTPGGAFQVMDPSAGGKVSVFTMNHKKLKVRVHRVKPEDWAAFVKYMRAWDNDRKRGTLPGDKVIDEIIEVKGELDDLVETRVDLGRALKGGKGLLIVNIEPTVQPARRWEWQGVHAWVQATDLGVTAFTDHEELVGWTTSLKDGKPLAGVELSITPHKLSAKSGDDGLTRFALPKGSPKGVGMIVARRGDDVAMLPEWISWWDEGSHSGWQKNELGESLAWYVADDRGMYKPGEEVRIKGWLRRIGLGERGDVAALGNAATKVSWKLNDSQGNEIGKGTESVDAAGGFHLKLTLPKTVNLGAAYMELRAQGAGGVGQGRDGYHVVQIQEFRRPEFEVTAATNPGPHFVGSHATVTATAKYFAGGPLPGAPAEWWMYASPASFTPPEHDEYTFGTWMPWWGYYDWMTGRSTQEGKNYAGKTDASGEHSVRLDFDSVTPPRAMNVTAQASIMDVNRQAWAASTTVLVHPSAHYVGLKSGRYFVQEGEPIDLDAVVADLDGKRLAGRPIAMRAARLDWTWKDGKYETTEEDVQDCTVLSAAKGATDARCSFTPKEGGVYKLRAVVKDDQGRTNESELTMWVAGGEQPPQREVGLEQVTIIPSQKEFKPGDVAELLVQAPFENGEAQVQVQRNGLITTTRLAIKGTSATIKVPIESWHVPNVRVEVHVVGAAKRSDDLGRPSDKLPKRPAFAAGAINLSVPPRERTLSVEVKPEHETLEPGTETWVNVRVKDAKGNPVAGSQVAVVVVDEAILALTGYRWPDPVAAFYPERQSGVGALHQRQYVVLAKPEDTAGGGADNDADGLTTEDEGSVRRESATRGAPGGGAGGGAAPPPPAVAMPSPKAPSADKPAESAGEEVGGAPGQAPQPGIALRTNFDALAFYNPGVDTDKSGLVAVKVKVPDNLTRYRVTAVAVSGAREFGKGEAVITARLPLMVRPSPPRFLNFGDEFELPVVLQNQTDAPMTVMVAARGTNLVLKESLGRRVTVPANDRLEVRFPAAADRPGTARVQLAAVSGKWTDAAEVSLPVWTPATTEAFATYGEIDKGSIVQPVKTPGEVWPQFGGVEVTTSSTAVAALTDAFLYLVSYPYDCAEQISSRLMAVAGLRDVLDAFAAPGLPSKAELLASVSRDLEMLKNLQNWDGGFAFWRRGDESWPWISVHGAHAIQRAKEKGFTVDATMMARSQDYLRNVERHIPGWYSPESRRAIIAYALYVRERMGMGDHKRAQKLIVEAGGVEKVPLEVCGWLLFVLSGDSAATADVEALRKHLNNRVDETAAFAHFTTSYSDGAYLLLHSDRRADGVILEALIKDQPKNDLIPKIVKGLLAHRKAGKWANTNESSFVLLALDNYFAVYEKVTPDFVARIWLGDQYAGEHTFKGRTTEEHEVLVPMKWLVDAQAKLKGKSQDLVIEKKGDGRLYYRIGMRYAPKDLNLKPRDAGFVVVREYEGVDSPDDVKRDAKGVWHVKAGAKVRVRLTMVASSRRYHVALVDPLPAGFEPMNPALAITGEVPRDNNPGKGMNPNQWWYWTMYWYQHENMRDERVEAFTTMLWEGVYNYTYVARATTPGSFVVPPTKAEEMYTPETFGRGGTDRVVIE